MSYERPKVAWLEENRELADDAGVYRLLYGAVDVPWSAEPEHWVLTVDEQGFVYGDRYDSESEAIAACVEQEDDCGE